MSEYEILIFSGSNIDNPQNPGSLPIEDETWMSDLSVGDQITWLGGAENAFVSISSPSDAFNESSNNQTLTSDIIFDGVSYSAGQNVTPTYTIGFTGSDGNTYSMTSFNFRTNTQGQVPDAVFWVGDIPPPNTVLTVASESNPSGGASVSYSKTAVCFTSGTRILTPNGERNVGTLMAGDIV